MKVNGVTTRSEMVTLATSRKSGMPDVMSKRNVQSVVNMV